MIWQKSLPQKALRVLITTSTHIAKPGQYRTGDTEAQIWMRRRIMPVRSGIRAVSFWQQGKQVEDPDNAWKLAMPEDLGEERV